MKIQEVKKITVPTTPVNEEAIWVVDKNLIRKALEDVFSEYADGSDSEMAEELVSDIFMLADEWFTNPSEFKKMFAAMAQTAARR